MISIKMPQRKPPLGGVQNGLDGNSTSRMVAWGAEQTQSPAKQAKLVKTIFKTNICNLWKLSYGHTTNEETFIQEDILNLIRIASVHSIWAITYSLPRPTHLSLTEAPLQRGVIKKTGLSLPSSPNQWLSYFTRRAKPPAFHIPSNSKVKRLNSWWELYYHPALTHRMEVLSQAWQTKNTGASITLIPVLTCRVEASQED